MAKPNPIGLQVTKGHFEIRGIVKGTDKETFYKELTTKTNKPMRMVSFGVEYNAGKTIYIRLNGMEKSEVYFSKPFAKNKKEPSETIKVPWSERFSFRKDDYQVMGVTLGITQTNDPSGNMVNDKRVMTEYDACKYLADNLEEDTSVYVRGKIEFSTYNGKQKTNFVPTQVSLCKPVDFNDPNFKETANFDQTVIFMGISKLAEKEFSVSAKVVDYNSLENAEFIIENPIFAKTIKGLKPYTSVKLFGEIRAEKETTEVKSNGSWGAPNPMERINNPTVWKFLVTGGDESSVDTTLYNEKSVNAALDKLKADASIAKDFGSAKKNETQGSWGTNPSSGSADDAEDDEDDPW